WLIQRWIELYGKEKTAKMCTVNLERNPMSIRVQPLKIPRQEAMERLKEEGFLIRPSLFSSQGNVIEEGNVLTSSLIKIVLITIQDETSILVGEMLDVSPEVTCLDACSAPGGNSTDMCVKMADQGRIHAYDSHEKKTTFVQEKAKQLQLSIISAEQADARDLNAIHNEETFDRIVVDAPC